MRKITLSILAIVFGLSLWGQIPNAGFEDWEENLYGGMQPVNWWAIYNSANFNNIYQTSPGHTGEYAVELKPTEMAGVGTPSSILISEPFPVSQRYGELSGYFKGTLAGSDTLYIIGLLFKEDMNDPLAVAPGIYTETVEEFTEFHVNFDYYSSDDPDSCLITVIVGSLDLTMAHIGSTFTIDDLALSGSAGVGDHETAQATFGTPWPNPATDQLNIPFELTEPNEVTLEVYNTQGKLIFTSEKMTFSQGAQELTLDVSSYTPGIYFYRMSTGKDSMISKTFVVK